MKKFSMKSMKKLKNEEFEVKTIINLILYITIILMPFIVYKQTNSPYLNGKMIYMYIVGAILVGLALLSKKEMFNFFLEKIIALMFGVALIISTIFAINPGLAFMGNKTRNEGLLMFLTYIILFIMSAKYIKLNSKGIDIILIASCLMAIYSIFQFYGIDPVQRYLFNSILVGESIGFIGHRNFLSSYTILFIDIAILLYVFRGKIKYLVMASILFACLLCTTTRGGWASCVIVLFLMGIMIFRKKECRKRFVIILIIFISIFIILDFSSSNRLSSRANTITSDADRLLKGDTSNLGSHRSDIWKMVIKSIKMHPIVGGGLDSLQLRLTRDVPEDNKYIMVTYNEIVDKSHNEFLELWASGGLLALLCYITLLCIVYKNIIKNIKEEKFKIMFVCLTGYLMQSLANISVIGVAPIYWILLGAIVKSYRDKQHYNIKNIKN